MFLVAVVIRLCFIIGSFVVTEVFVYVDFVGIDRFVVFEIVEFFGFLRDPQNSLTPLCRRGIGLRHRVAASR